jgi:hypothetical protein
MHQEFSFDQLLNLTFQKMELKWLQHQLSYF